MEQHDVFARGLQMEPQAMAKWLQWMCGDGQLDCSLALLYANDIYHFVQRGQLDIARRLIATATR